MSDLGDIFDILLAASAPFMLGVIARHVWPRSATFEHTLGQALMSALTRQLAEHRFPSVTITLEVGHPASAERPTQASAA